MERRYRRFCCRGCGFSSRMLARFRQVEEGILADGAPLRTIDYLQAGQTLVLCLPEDTVRVEPVDYPLEVVHEDAGLLVVNKPPYLAVHPSAGKTEPTLAAAVVGYYRHKGESHAFRPLGRLDRNTSGLLATRKTPIWPTRWGAGSKKNTWLWPWEGWRERESSISPFV